MLSVQDLQNANSQLWRSAANDAATAAGHCQDVATYARDDVARTLTQHWTNDTGLAARRDFVTHAVDYEAARDALWRLVRTYETLADAIDSAQRTLEGALDYASSHGLTVSGAGEVTSAATGRTDTTVLDYQIGVATGLVSEALNAATTADTAAATEIRTIEALTTVTDPALVAKAFQNGTNNPFAIALRLSNGRDSLHAVNVGQSQLDDVRQASLETGISEDLLMSILWQEQQWYQNGDPGLGGPQGWAGHAFDWALEESARPGKSLGITHMKLATARQVIAGDPAAFTVDGRSLNDLSDPQLTKYIEENPNEDIRLSAHYLAQLRQNQHGATTDKDLFLLYAADTQQVRDANAQYGDDTGPRGGAVRPRAQNWDKLQPHLQDTDDWEALTEAERRQAMDELASQTPLGHSVTLETMHPGPPVIHGTGPAQPGTPSPLPAPPPIPPSH